jgi:regulator of protease activity HflC (stomatin/prohibitin superfamily)
MGTFILLCVGAFILFLLLILLPMSLFTVEQQKIGIVERFGKFVRLAKPGLHVKIPFIDRVVSRMSLRVLQLNIQAETKTEDNVFVQIIVAVQYYVIPDKVYDAYYKLDNAERQINSYVFDVVRAKVPKIKLDDLFEKKDDIAQAVKLELNETMKSFGFEILNTLVTDIEPNAKVKESMNEINAAQRLRVAASEKGEADRILKVKSAEADAQSKALQGKGIADQRKAIIDGLKESVEHFKDGVSGATTQDVMNLVLLTQYFDTIKELGHSANTNTILLPHSPSGMTDLAEQVRNAMIVGSETARSNSSK